MNVRLSFKVPSRYVTKLQSDELSTEFFMSVDDEITWHELQAIEEQLEEAQRAIQLLRKSAS